MRPSFNAVLLLAAAPAVLPAVAGAATVTTYTNRATYTAAVAAAGLGPGVLETFDTDRDFNKGDNLYNTLNFRVTTDSRKTFVANRVTVFGDGQTQNGMLDGEEDGPATGTFYESLEYVLPTASKAFGGDFAIRNFSYGGAGITLTILGQRFDLANYLAPSSDPDYTSSGFFGVVADQSFTVVDPSVTNTTRFGENYFLDNLTYSPASVAANPVPEPLTACGAAIGLGGLVLRRRRPLA